jgi:hypothetical protein
LLEGESIASSGYVLIPVLCTRSAVYDTAPRLQPRRWNRGFRDRDLRNALMEQGHALADGTGREGLRLADETMALTAGEPSPIVAGIVYCNTIAFCRDVYELRRARETAALTRWYEQQPDMVAHQGLCLVHRAEIMTLVARGGTRSKKRRVGERFTQEP